MGQFFNSRDWLRTPTFVDKDLYEPLPDSAQFDDAPLPSREMRQEMPSAPLPTPPPTQPMREYDGGPSVDPGPQARQRITLEAAPLPPKPGLMRQIIGTAAGAYLPQVGREILAPGYDRKMREYNNNRQRMMDEGKLNVQAADEAYKIAAARRQMADAETAAARKKAEESRAGSYGRPVIHGRPGETIFNQDGGVFATVAPLPPAAKSTIKIGRDGKPFFGEGVEGKDYILADSSVAPSIINSTARPDKGVAAISQIVDRQMPNATQEEKDAEVVRLWTEEKKLKADKEKALTDRAKRVPTGRTASPTASAVEARRVMDERALAAIADAGGDLDAAIAGATDAALQQALKAKKGKQALTPKRGDKTAEMIERIGSRLGVDSGKSPKAPAPTPKPVDKNKDPLGVR